MSTSESRPSDREVATVSNDGYRIREKLVSDYRIACPRGHTSLSPAETTRTAYCQTCGRAYPFEGLVDRQCEESATRES